MTPWVQRLLIANVLVFFAQVAAPGLTYSLELIPALVLYRPWTLFTYMFAHAGLGHIFFNMLSLFFFGPRVEERLGGRRFLTLYFIAGLSGALLTMLLAYNSRVVGASGAVFGVMLAFARFWPDVQILLWFIPVQARFAVIGLALMDLYSGIQGSRGGIANFCHLGGFVSSWIYLSYLQRRAGIKKFRTKTVSAVPKETLAGWKRVDPTKVHEVNRDEVNRILDKISAKGIASLTPQEKLFLSNFVPPDDRVAPKT